MHANEVLKLMEAMERTIQYIDRSTDGSNENEINHLSNVKKEILLTKAKILNDSHFHSV